MRSHPSLAIFPIISGLATLMVSISFMLPIFFSLRSSGVFESSHFDKGNVSVAYYVVSFLYYLVSYFVVVFFNVGLIHCASEVLAGRPTSVGDGLRAATRRLGPILGWSLIGATVGVILKSISERVGIVGQIVVALLGGAWNLITFFVVPALALEGVGPVDAIKTSFDTIKKTWGETIIGNVGVSWAIGLLSLLPIPIFIAVCFTGSAWIIFSVLGLAILYWIALAVIGSCLSGIYTTAVFHYARTGHVPSMFSAQQIQSAFLPQQPNKVTNFIRRGR